MTMIHEVTAIVISFLRPGYTKACIRSLRKQYPKIKIIVGENAHFDKGLAKVCTEVGAEYVQLPYDSGVCFARNRLMERVQTKYVLVGDDDFFYTKSARVDEMVDFLQHCEDIEVEDPPHLIGGRVSVGGKVQNYQGFIEKHDDHFESKPLDLDREYEGMIEENYRFRVCEVDLTFNYFVALAEKVREVPWDEEIKVAYEHYSWFYDFKCAGGRVAFSPDPVVVHKPAHVNPEYTDDYGKFRNRKSDRARFFEKYEIDYAIDMRGHRSYSPNYVQKRKKSTLDTKYVDFCITTFKRPQALERLLDSIVAYYPTANIYVADQNEKLDRAFYRSLRMKLQRMGLIKRLAVDHLPYDCGLGYARNYLMTKTPNMYKVILDDDMVFTEETDIGKMVELMKANPKCGIVGGLVKQLGHEVHFEFKLGVEGGTILQYPDKEQYRHHEGIKYKKTGCVLNFAMMRKDMFVYIQWDNDLKVSEHTDFYLRMKHVPMYILYTPDVVIDHPPAPKDWRYREYKELRQRQEFTIKMLRKHGADRMKYLNGQVFEIGEDGKSIKKYKEIQSV